MKRQHHFRSMGFICLMLFALSGSSCPPTGDPPDPDPTPDPDPVPPVTIQESEPNDALTDLTSGVLESGDHVRIEGSISEAEEIDLYYLGPLAKGDRLSIRMQADNTELDPNLAVFDLEVEDESGTLFVTMDDEPSGASLNPRVDEVIRHSADHYILGISTSYFTLLGSGAYIVDIEVIRGGQAPAPQSQHVVINFEGGTATSVAGTTFTIEPFDPSAIDETYAGMGGTIRALCLAALRENFTDYHVTITSSDEAPPSSGVYSVVHIGQVANTQELAGTEGLGIAIDGVDSYNANPQDVGVIFVNNFIGSTFGLLQPLEPDALARALANVTSHEIGHMLGLHHTFDPASPMNTLDSASTLLLDQRFKRSLLFFGIFGLGNIVQQDADLMLRETVGGIYRFADVTIPVGEQPLAAVKGDVDGDGDTDILVVNRSSNSISVLGNDGFGNLFVVSTIPVSGAPIDIRLIDLDGDGDLDAAVSMGSTNDVGFLINDGFGVFVQTSETLAVAEGPFGLDAADVDGDGDQDLAVVSLFANQVSVLTNNQTGGADLAQVMDVGDTPRSVSIADLDADGSPDLLVANTQDRTVSVLYGQGDGTFEEAISLIAGSLPISVDTGDMDGDGDEDIIVVSSISNILTVQFASNVSVLFNEGNRSFASGKDYFVGAFAQYVTADDLDVDGDLDLVVACGGDLFVPSDLGRLSFLFNQGDGTFAQDVKYEAGVEPFGVVSGDLDGDGLPEVVGTNTGSNDISVFYNYGDGEFGFTADIGAFGTFSKPIRRTFQRSTLRPPAAIQPLPRPVVSGRAFCLTCRRSEAKCTLGGERSHGH